MALELGKRIATLRKIQKKTQAQLAEYLAVQPQTVSRWEAEGGMPDITLLPKIALFFSISIDELFGMTDMEQIDNLVYKYSVLRDETSFEEVTRSMTMALNSIEEQWKEETKDEIRLELKRKKEQLLAWKVHIYIQKSRKAQEEAEELLDKLLLEVDSWENPLYLSLKLQKQQFLIQKGKGQETLYKVKEQWEYTQRLEYLHCYMSALLELERGQEILQLWQQKKVQKIVAEITDEIIPLWKMMFYGAKIEKNLELFYHYFYLFKEKAGLYDVFEVEWMLADLYESLKMQKEKEEQKEKLLKMLENISLNEYIKINYLKRIQEL